MWIFWGIALSLLLPIFGSVICTLFLPNSRLVYLPVHSLVETAGGFMAVAIAGILVVERTRNQEPGTRNQESGIRNQESGIRPFYLDGVRSDQYGRA
jgi:hypothetical protein